MSANDPEHLSDDDLQPAVLRLVRQVEATRRRTPREAREVRDQITREGVKAGVPARRQPPRKQQKPPATRPKAAPLADPPWNFAAAAPLDTGEYETVRELSTAGPSIVYAAKRTGEETATPKFVVKALVPPVIWSAEQTRERVKAFLAAAELQQRVAAAHPRGNWAPIYGAPTEVRGRGAYYVTDRFVRTADDLASPQREAASEEDLFWLVSGVVDGLEQLEKTADRPHGNLKSGNVLLARKKNRYRAALSDPLADGTAATKAGRAKDLRDLGDLIRRLVLRDTGGTDAATASLLGAEGAWARLGKTAGAWRALCGALLEGGTRFPTYADLRKALWPLRVANANRNRKRMAIAAALVLAAAGTTWAAWPKSYRPGDWRALCHRWEWFQNARALMFAYRKPGADAKLDDALSIDATAMDPKRIATGVTELYGGLEKMADAPPLGATSQAGISNTRVGLALIDVIHTRMLPGRWGFYKDAQDLSKTIDRKENEPRLAASISRCLDESKAWVDAEGPTRPPDDLLFFVELVGSGPKDLSGQLKRLNAACQEVEAAAPWKDGNVLTTDPFLKTLAERIRANVDRPPWAAGPFGVTLATGHQLSADVLAKLGPNSVTRYDWARIRVEVDSRTALPGGDLGLASQDAVHGWLDTVAPAYAFVVTAQDPRKATPWAKTLAVDVLATRIAAARKQPGASEEWQRALNVVEGQVTTLAKGNTDFVGRTFVNRDQAELDARARELLASSATLSKAIGAIEAQVEVDPVKWLPAIRETAGIDGIRSPAVGAFWSQQKTRLLNRYTDPKDFNVLYREVHTKLTLTAHAFDDLLAPSQPVKGEDAAPWAKPFRDFEAGYRERQLTELCAKLLALPARGDIPPGFLNDDVPRAQAVWTGWQQSLATWITRGIDLHAWLLPAGGLYALDETPPGETSLLAASWRTWLDAVNASTDPINAAVNDAAVKAALVTLDGRYQSLAAVLGDAPPAATVKAMLADGRPPEESWAGWRASGKLQPPDWLALPQELSDRDAALKLASTVPIRERAAALDKAIRDDGRQRWLRRVKPPAAAAATQPADRWPAGLATVEAALPLRDAFQIGDDATLDPKARYNLRLAELIADARPLVDAKTAVAQATGNEKALALLTRFLENMKADGATTSEASVAKLVEKLQQAKIDAEDPKLATRASTVPLTEENRGWVKLPNAAGETDEDALAFQHPGLLDANNKPVVLQFARVDVSDGAPSAFVLRNAVSIDQFSAALPLMKDPVVPVTDSFAVGTFGAVDAATKHLTPRKFWVEPGAVMATQRIDPLVLGQRDAPSPDGSLPMQSISSALAKSWAAKMGLRLPTVSEWRAAAQLEAAGGARRWNVRDAAWKAQDDYFRNKLNAFGATALSPQQMRRFGRDKEDGRVWNADLTGPAPDGQTPYNDGALLLLPAVPGAADRASGIYGKTFYHVVGNVWQFVTEGDATLVAGGSALSAPVQGLYKPWPVSADRFAVNFDVGFRVAFEAPVQRPRTRLLAAVRAAELLHD